MSSNYCCNSSNTAPGHNHDDDAAAQPSEAAAEGQTEGTSEGQALPGVQVTAGGEMERLLDNELLLQDGQALENKLSWPLEAEQPPKMKQPREKEQRLEVKTLPQPQQSIRDTVL